MIINGKKKELNQPMTVLEMLNGYMLNRHVVVIHVNGKIVPTSAYGQVVLTNNDTVQLTTIVAGG